MSDLLGSAMGAMSAGTDSNKNDAPTAESSSEG